MRKGISRDLVLGRSSGYHFSTSRYRVYGRTVLFDQSPNGELIHALDPDPSRLLSQFVCAALGNFRVQVSSGMDAVVLRHTLLFTCTWISSVALLLPN